MERKRKTKEPCSSCGLHKTLCLCDSIPRFETSSRLCLVIHHREMKRTTNTGVLALRALANSEMRIRGLENQPLDLTDLVADLKYQTLLFYPADEAVELDANFMAKIDRPVQLIVPDGNWRQASKVHYRHQELRSVPRVKIGKANVATEHLRAEHRPEGMSTLEAIAEAFAVIENAEVGAALKKLYQLKLERTLIGRGQSK